MLAKKRRGARHCDRDGSDGKNQKHLREVAKRRPVTVDRWRLFATNMVRTIWETTNLLTLCIN